MTTPPVHRFDVFRQADHTAHEWLAEVARYLGTEDRHRAHRVMRAWLHTVRDRLPVDSAVHFGAQLPLLWRGVFYDGWLPRQVPVKYDADQFLMTVAHDSDLSAAEARQAVAAVTAALAALTSAEQIGHLLAQLPEGLRELLDPGVRGRAALAQQPAGPPTPRSSPETIPLSASARLERLERDVQIVADALGALVDALDERPSSQPEPMRATNGARRAHQLLLSRSTAG